MGFLASQPPDDYPVPADLLEVIGEVLPTSSVTQASVEPIWLNTAGGLTVAVHTNSTLYIKRNPLGNGESLAVEAQRMRWLAKHHPVPEIVDYVRRDGAEFLVTRAVNGTSAVLAPWRDQPDAAVRAIATGLKLLHAIPVTQCPYTWSVAERLTQIQSHGAEIPTALQNPPAVDRLVVCHGDACAPNTLLGSDGSFRAHVDLARLGVADRWADLAVATMSLEWNYPRFNIDLFWDAYGIGPDVERISFYRDLWNAA